MVEMADHGGNHRCFVEKNVPIAFILPSRWQDSAESLGIEHLLFMLKYFLSYRTCQHTTTKKHTMNTNVISKFDSVKNLRLKKWSKMFEIQKLFLSISFYLNSSLPLFLSFWVSFSFSLSLPISVSIHLFLSLILSLSLLLTLSLNKFVF